MGGWIAQDSGDYITAARLTIRAADHLRAAEPALRAMILMRRSNIVVREDPDPAVDLAASVAQLIEGQSVGRLAASITRQQASAALANHDHVAFREHAAHALDLADIDPRLTITPSTPAAPTSPPKSLPGTSPPVHADKAAELLLAHDGRWPAAQRRDFAVAATPLLRAFIAQGDYHAATHILLPPSAPTRRAVRPSSPRAADVPQDRA